MLKHAVLAATFSTALTALPAAAADWTKVAEALGIRSALYVPLQTSGGVIALAIIATKQGYLTFANTAAPSASLKQLLIALVAGLVLIVPSLGLLIWIFKFRKKNGAPSSRV